MTLPSWVETLPQVRGRYKFGAALSEMTWFAVGGPADVLFRPEDLDDLSHFLKNKPAGVPITVLGVGSNILVRDGGLPGIVIRLGRNFTKTQVEGHQIHVGAGCLDRAVALVSSEAGIAGLEFLVGIPGTIGGAVKMNAGAYGAEMKDILVSASLLSLDGQLKTMTADDLQMTYRHTSLGDDHIVVGATIQGRPGDPTEIHTRLQSILADREASQPTRGRTGGSTFKNPKGYSAWKLIDKAGCRGLMRGDAQVSEKHCNFLMNTGACRASDLESLGEEVRARVKENSGIELEWEIIRLGR